MVAIIHNLSGRTLPTNETSILILRYLRAKKKLRKKISIGLYAVVGNTGLDSTVNRVKF